MTKEFKPTKEELGFSLGDEELVPESCGPFGDYYVPRSKLNRSRAGECKVHDYLLHKSGKGLNFCQVYNLRKVAVQI